jgi:hypothetical protein
MKGRVKVRKMDAQGRVVDTAEFCNIVVDAGEAFLADFMAEDTTATLWPMRYMAIGTGTTAPADSDTALEYEVGTRVTGDKSSSGSVYQVVATFPTGNPPEEVAITELGIFNQYAAGGTLFNRLTFGTITKGTQDQIEFTVQITID